MEAKPLVKKFTSKDDVFYSAKKFVEGTYDILKITKVTMEFSGFDNDTCVVTIQHTGEAR